MTAFIPNTVDTFVGKGRDYLAEIGGGVWVFPGPGPLGGGGDVGGVGHPSGRTYLNWPIFPQTDVYRSLDSPMFPPLTPRDSVPIGTRPSPITRSRSIACRTAASFVSAPLS